MANADQHRTGPANAVTAGLDAAVGSVMAALDPPAVIVTAAAGGRRAGCMATFSTQCSMHPLRYLVCIARPNATFTVVQAASTLAVHVPTAADIDLAQLFGGHSGDDIDKFARVPWHPWEDGTPLLEGCAWFVGRILSRHDLGDHVGVAVEPVAAWDHLAGPSLRRDEVLRHHDVRDIEPGHAL